MVSKLLKHDLKSVLRIIVPMQAILLIISIFTKCVNLIPFENDAVFAVQLALNSSYYISLAISVILTFITIIVRFYRNMFTHEGYLTFTLPAIANQHLISKILMSIIATLVSVIMILLSLLIVYYEKNFILGNIRILLIYLNRLSEKILAVEIIMLIIITAITSYIFIYACICLGQRANKHRIIAAVAIYYGFQFVVQFLFVAILSITTITEFLEKIVEFLYEISPHAIVIPLIFINLAVGFVFYLVCHNSISKHLNLE
jgi:hypothetical protein